MKKTSTDKRNFARASVSSNRNRGLNALKYANVWPRVFSKTTQRILNYTLNGARDGNLVAAVSSFEGHLKKEVRQSFFKWYICEKFIVRPLLYAAAAATFAPRRQRVPVRLERLIVGRRLQKGPRYKYTFAARCSFTCTVGTSWGSLFDGRSRRAAACRGLRLKTILAHLSCNENTL